jgi:hypothetical protein
MSDTNESSDLHQFQLGDKARVKYGVTDPDFPDIPLGGWCGTVTEVEMADDPITFEIKWDKRTLRSDAHFPGPGLLIYPEGGSSALSGLSYPGQVGATALGVGRGQVVTGWAQAEVIHE